MVDDVLFEVEGALGVITLNRPHALNALTLPMMSLMYAQLAAWRQDDCLHAVVLRGVGSAFCAGGDVRWLYRQRGHLQQQLAFFEQEYQLDQLIHDYPKPIIGLMQGITMGGGAGIGLHTSHPVASASFVFAMPETTIGFFPDIGSSYWLTRLPGALGRYLGLTGARLTAMQAWSLGLVKTVMDESTWPSLFARLHQADLSQQAHERVSALLNVSTLSPLAFADQARVDAFFMAPGVADLLQALKASDDPWAVTVGLELAKKSPLSLYVTWMQWQRAQGLSLSACLKMDLGLVTHFMQDHDFYEGVRALLIDKDNQPRWNPTSWDTRLLHQATAYFAT